MRRLCERPGCSGPASVSYGMDASARVVWIDPSPSVDPARAGSLCRRHADALKEPMGWTLDDRREPVPRLLRVKENPAPVDVTPSRGARRRKANDATPAPSLFETRADDAVVTPIGRMADNADGGNVSTVEPADDVATADEETPDETKAIPWVPRLGQGSVEGDAPRGRLLGRAFGERHR